MAIAKKKTRPVKFWAITLGRTKTINAFIITQYGLPKNVLTIFRKKADAMWCAQSHNNVIPLYITGGK